MNFRKKTTATPAAQTCPLRSCLCIQPCITISIHTQVLIAHKTRESGNTDFLMKEFSPSPELRRVIIMNFENTLLNYRYIVKVPLAIYETYSLDVGIVAVKIFQKEKYDKREIEIGIGIVSWGEFPFLVMEYANMKTLDIIAKQPQIPLPSFALRALMKQILEGMRAFHSADLVHRDIKCDNILLHSPPGSGRVYAKISDFGFSKKVDFKNEQTYLAGTLPFMSPEQFNDNPIITQKVDIYALGITFYKLITHKYPVNERNIKEQAKKMIQLKSIERPSQIKDNLLWDLLQSLLEFDPNKRISAAQALQHSYFTSPEAIADVSKEQQDLASLAAVSELEENSTITQFDKDPTFIVSETKDKENDIEQNEQKDIELNSQLFHHSHTISQLKSSYASLSYIAKEEQLQAERDLLELNMTLEELKLKFENFDKLSLIQRCVILMNLIKLLKDNKEN
ncbi:MAG: hypothetical protein EZS28_020819 [Streblomastix strix]|uniref:Protein kinase domain-containing protein n=1 Tax=Streblomastix strix TaxID=222440 RepID=A0A5J4VMJ1_9EUKA|nr:MAG: hypothetical protein EZS28_020819 [Streblomastix strix]